MKPWYSNIRPVDELREWVEQQPVGKMLYIATSQYADNTIGCQFRFDFWSNASAVRALIKSGELEGFCGWRHYQVRRPVPGGDR